MPSAVWIRHQLRRVGKRLVLPDVSTTALREHRKQQLQERLKAGAAWVDSGLVFTTYAPRGDKRKQGTGLPPRNVVRVFHAILDSTDPKLLRIRFHDLRHSAASLLIASGVELVEVSKLLGHSESESRATCTRT